MEVDNVKTDFEAPAVYVARPYAFHASSFRSSFRIVVFSVDIVLLLSFFKHSLFEAEINRFLNGLSFAKALPHRFGPEVIHQIRGIRGLNLAADLGRFLSLSEEIQVWSGNENLANDFPFVRLLKHLQENLVHGVSLNEAAHIAGMKLFPFIRSFKKNMGMTFVDFLTSLRLERSEVLLRHSKNSVTEIASTSGFQTLSYFNRVFRRRYGVTPSDFRKNPAAHSYS